ncbi:ATP-binding cassette domain-containing protein [Corynebacterium macginleyi]|uniref:ABC transporter ATP-binding protein n=1 Tax=Corynebacterium macginleyi TaxID=38290 RepID=A0ABS1Y5Z3_9CORY|nr:ABC transporter ATP-binding protein [Corynebacterium macginleyi]MBK4140974.1 ATP-binding cassette domain-containing protein [Corynebacterium macginleyi]MBK4143278.1 ATP-binding cassette domain-containing protein [Corynebacterium macginleyi]MBK4161310.1 ATP-binding cassette domain-containing protein [Corynebacterium macginleyi]MBK4166663.1 ATP-binding cassette domain-containing protein [Corynebacterium macginleyi]MBK4173354.1 ATP-binding cassette domain-containing protein [Corynebacterium ma
MNAIPADSPALSLQGVVKRYGPTSAVNGLSLSVAHGEIFCLLGPNGAGKSTTIEMSEGFIRPTAGSIKVLGIDPSTAPDRVREKVGIMLQGGGSYSGIRVQEMLELTARYNTNPLSPHWLLETLGLQGVARTPYRRLSGGQQQRLSLALAVIGRPELVFLDEPTAGMDAQSRLAVWDLIRALKRDGVTVIVTTHLMDEAESLADHIAIMDHGALVAQGTPEELTSQGDRAGFSFSTNSPVDIEAVQQIGIPATTSRPLHYRVNQPNSPELVSALAAELARQSVLLQSLESHHRNLEEVFLDLTGRHLRS